MNEKKLRALLFLVLCEQHPHMGGGGGGGGVDSIAQKEVTVPSGFSENKVWVAVLSSAGWQTSF